MQTFGKEKFIAVMSSIALAGLLVFPVPGVAGPVTADQMSKRLSDSARSEADKQRDADRKPAEVIEFIGIEPGMTIMDVMAASGWYTEVLSLAVGDAGKVYAQNPAFILEFRDGANDKALAARLAGDRLANVERVDTTIEESGIPAGTFDVMFTALSFHDTYYMGGEESAARLLAEMGRLLKPDGRLVIIDHNGRPDLDNAKLHRIPRDIVLNMAMGAGYILEAEADMLAHPDDDGTQMVFMKPLRGKTDRFVLKFRKDN
jgi:predicted methyltransferase